MNGITRECGICGANHEIYGGLHDPNMIDFRWHGFASDSVTVERFDLCPECRDDIAKYIQQRSDACKAREQMSITMQQLHAAAQEAAKIMQAQIGPDMMRSFLHKKYDKR